MHLLKILVLYHANCSEELPEAARAS